MSSGYGIRPLLACLYAFHVLTYVYASALLLQLAKTVRHY